MILRDPWYLCLAIVPPVLAWWRYRRTGEPAMPFPALAGCDGLRPSLRSRLRWLLPALRVAALTLSVIALARPQQGLQRIYDRQKAIDIVLTLDVSPSMRLADFVSNGRRLQRVEVVKSVVEQFISERPSDRLGMVVFAKSPYTVAPLTWDHDWLRARLGDISAGMVGDGTGIGGALSTALNRLRDSEARSRIVILLTDGANNINTITPEMAIAIAKALKVKVYTIGAGSQAAGEIDEDLLQKIARETGGRYYRATDAGTLRAVYDQINRLEKTEIEMPRYQQYVDLYPYFVLPALLLLLLEFVLGRTYLRRLP